MADPKPAEPIRESGIDARAGSTPGVVRYVLAASLILVVVLLALVVMAPGLFAGK